MDTLQDLFLGFDTNPIRSELQWILLLYSGVMLAMVVDLIAGVYKAKQAGIARTSTGYKKTLEKAIKYFCPMLILTIIDLLTTPILAYPHLTMACALYCGYCEFKSVWENTHTKEELRKQEKTMNIIIDNKEEIAEALISVMTKKGDSTAMLIEGLKAIAKKTSDK
ncbi:MAG: phage holin family protein [Bacteroidales bacterium]|nr:phage holin family protein [Bacteroidales bacterium]